MLDQLLFSLDQNMSPSEYLSRQSSGERMVLVDVREPEEYRQGHLDGAISVPLGVLSVDTLRQGGIDVPDKSGEILFYCFSGARSATACTMARSFGLVNARTLQGGILGLLRER